MRTSEPRKLVSLIKEPVGTGFRLSLSCNTCLSQFPLSECHHRTCANCKQAYCPEYVHGCLQAT